MANESSILNNWGSWLIHKVVHPFTVFVTPVFVLVLMIYLTANTFWGKGFYPGIRSLAGVLLPLIIATFIIIFKKELLERLQAIS